MRDKAQSYVKIGDYNSALIAANSALTVDKAHIISRLTAASINMMLGNEQETINNVNHFVEMENQSNLNKGSATIQWMVGAAILAKNGNHQSFTNYCVNMFKRFPVADEIIGERAAKAALMVDSSPDIAKKALEYTLHANNLREGGGFYNWSCFSVALGYYRTGDLVKSEEKSLESLSHTPDGHPWLHGLNNALLSMLYFIDGKKEKSEERLATADEALRSLEGNLNGLHDTMLIELLIKERESLVKK